MTYDSLILGSGIVGYTLYKKYGFTTIGNGFFVPPLFHIHSTPFVESFLLSQKVNYTKRQVKVGLWDGERLIDKNEVTSQMVDNYRRKTLKSSDSRCLNNLSLDYEIIEPVNLLEEGWFTQGTVTNIRRTDDRYLVSYVDSDRKSLVIKCSKILSTIPLPSLLRLLGSDIHWDWRSSHKAWKPSNKGQSFINLDYVYDLSSSPVNRYFQSDTLWLEEYSLATVDQCDQYSQVMKNVQIRKNLNWEKEPVSGISLFGRLSQWSNSILLHNVIERIETRGI